MQSKPFAVALLTTGALAVPATTTCQVNNCQRAVVASSFTTRHTKQDCSSFLLTTVTPATSTVTATTTTTTTSTATVQITQFTPVTVTVPNTILTTATVTLGAPAELAERAFNPYDLVRHPEITPAVQKRQVTKSPSSIPAYASACSGSSAYSSACSCIGVHPSTTTAATPTTTTTRTVTATSTVSTTSTQTLPTTTFTTISTTVTAATVTITPPAACTSSFLVQAGGGSPYDGQYAQVGDSGDGMGDDVISFLPNIAAASAFTIDAAGHLHVDNEYANTSPGSAAFLFYFNTPAQIADSGYAYATCLLAGNPLAQMLQCNDEGKTIFQICNLGQSTGSGLVIGTTLLAGCSPITLTAFCT